MPHTPVGLDKTPFKPVQVVLVLREEVVQALAQVSELRNSMARAEGMKIPGRGWSRTSLAVQILERAAANLVDEMAPMVSEHGPLPVLDLARGNDADEKERFRSEMDRYVRKVKQGRKK